MIILSELLVRVMAWILRVITLACFTYLVIVHVKRYYRQDIFTQVRRYLMPMPNMTFCPADVEQLAVGKPNNRSLELSGDQMIENAERMISKFSICIGGSGTNKRRCEFNGGRTMGDWHKATFYPAILCLTYVPRVWYDGSRRVVINLSEPLVPGQTETYVVLHVGSRGPVQPGQDTAVPTVYKLRSGTLTQTALQLWEFRRVITEFTTCDPRRVYDKTKCEVDCRWNIASRQVGCRGHWQQLAKNGNMTVCDSQGEIELFHNFLNSSVRSCGHICPQPCLNRDYVVIDRFMSNLSDKNATLEIKLSKDRLQVQEFVRYTSNKLFATIGGNIGLLLGWSALSVLQKIDHFLKNLPNKVGNRQSSPDPQNQFDAIRSQSLDVPSPNH